MKPLLSLFVLICLYTAPINAQSSKAPRWMCGKGYWVIQSNLYTPKESIIYFYTNQHQLVYKETICGKRINPERTKTRKHLEAVLSQAVTAWQKEGVAKENQQMVVTIHK
jgi:hypothetical protein